MPCIPHIFYIMNPVLTFHALPHWLSTFVGIVNIVELLGSFTSACTTVWPCLGALLLAASLGGLVALALIGLAVARLVVVVVVTLVGHGSVGIVRRWGGGWRVLGVGRRGDGRGWRGRWLLCGGRALGGWLRGRGGRGLGLGRVTGGLVIHHGHGRRLDEQIMKQSR